MRGGQSFGGGAVSRRHGAVSECRLVSEREVRDPRGGGREGGHTAGEKKLEVVRRRRRELTLQFANGVASLDFAWVHSRIKVSKVGGTL